MKPSQDQVFIGVVCAASTARLAIPQEKNLSNEEARPWRAALFKVMLPEIVLRLQVCSLCIWFLIICNATSSNTPYSNQSARHMWLCSIRVRSLASSTIRTPWFAHEILLLTMEERLLAAVVGLKMCQISLILFRVAKRAPLTFFLPFSL
jgi:hypothetical protein